MHCGATQWFLHCNSLSGAMHCVHGLRLYASGAMQVAQVCRPCMCRHIKCCIVYGTCCIARSALLRQLV